MVVASTGFWAVGKGEVGDWDSEGKEGVKYDSKLLS